MAGYTPTQAAVVLRSQGDPSMLDRVMEALIGVCKTKYSTPGGPADKAYIVLVTADPVRKASDLLPLLLGTMTVADPTQPPTDAEITAGINLLWPVLTGQ